MLPEQLLDLIGKGDSTAFRQVYALFKDKVFNTCLSYLQVQEEAEEATQDVFVTIYNNASQFQNRSSAATWIYRITVNKCLDRLRSNKRKSRAGFLSNIFNAKTGSPAHDPPDFHHPGIQLEQKERAAALFHAIKQLPPNQQTAFILRYIETLSQREAAAVMEITEKALESLLQRPKQT